jgi:hypothetical protein
MIAALASAALIAAGSLAIGQAILFLSGRREWTWLAGPVGLAALLTLSGIVVRIGDHGTAIAITCGVAVLASAVYLGARGGGHGGPSPALLSAGLAGLAASIPFIAAGAVGILGVGLVNDDMANHLLLSDWIGERFRPEPVLIDQGYPLGPHALVAGLSSALHASSIDVFAGLILVIPALTALVAYGALDGLRPAIRVPVAALVSLPYLAAAYLAQEAFKEPIIAVFLLAFALLLPKITEARQAVPLGVLAAGTVYVYSFPGLAWLLAAAIVWLAWRYLRNGELSAISSGTYALGGAAAIVTFAVLIAPEIPRLFDFIDFRALHPDRANDGGHGNLPGQLNPLEALGIWPTSEFRLSAGANSLPAVAFYAGALLALIGFALAAGRWLRAHGPAVLVALISAVLLYATARVFGTVYTSAKALAIAAPMFALITLGGLLGAAARPLRLLGAAIAIAMAASSFLILREAPVAPEQHFNELAEIRPLVAGEKVLFLGRDNFVVYELRGSKPFVAVKNFYDPYYAKPNTELSDVFSKFDFDSVDAETLAEFKYVLTTRAAYASGPPPGYRVVRETPSYVLWERQGGPTGRTPAEADSDPGHTVRCEGSDHPSGRAAVFAQPPVVARAADWSQPTIHSGDEARVELTLRRGSWRISLAYDATREVHLQVASSTSINSITLADLPGNLDYRGPGPVWPAGEVQTTAPRTTVVITASVDDPPFFGRLFGANSVAHLGLIAASPSGTGYVRDGDEPLPGTGELLRPASQTCDHYVDWFEETR